MSSSKKLLQAAAGNAGESLYVEDVFSTYLYTGNGSTQTINNGIALSDEGGLVWLKNRGAVDSHALIDTVNGPTERLSSNSTDAGSDASPHFSFPAAGNTGFNLLSTGFNSASSTWASWSFRKAKKFFDVVTYSSDTTSGARTFSHNLGSTPAFIIVKGLNFGDAWYLYHIGTGVNRYLELNLTGTGHASTNFWGVTDSTFTVDSFLNNNGVTGRDYVAYLFASDAGGFGDDGSENIIKCGSYTGNGSADGPTINCGFEPQWLLIKNTSDGGNWVLMDAMRGMPVGDEATVLLPNTNGDESGYANLWGVDLQATGFKVNVSQIQINQSGGTMVYIAIRRPMKTPESGTEVFKPNYVDNGASSPDSISGFPVDMYFRRYVNTTNDTYLLTRLTSPNALKTNGTDAEAAFSSSSAGFDYQNGVMNIFSSDNSDFHTWMFKRATGFFDVVAYSGTGVAHNEEHNLGVAPELMIVKSRTDTKDWGVYNSADGAEYYTYLNSSGGRIQGGGSLWNDTEPTSTVFRVGAGSDTNASGNAYIAYLFATLAGVSKVGSYTGTGSNVDVDCGFSAGARFILIKRTDSTGDWYVYDSVRGIVAGNDPYLLLNSSAAEVTSTDYIDPLASGFTVTSSAPAALNASGGTYIFLAIA